MKAYKNRKMNRGRETTVQIGYGHPLVVPAEISVIPLTTERPHKINLEQSIALIPLGLTPEPMPCEDERPEDITELATKFDNEMIDILVKAFA